VLEKDITCSHVCVFVWGGGDGGGRETVSGVVIHVTHMCGGVGMGGGGKLSQVHTQHTHTHARNARAHNKWPKKWKRAVQTLPAPRTLLLQRLVSGLSAL
jgi:hypothetical protein